MHRTFVEMPERNLAMRRHNLCLLVVICISLAGCQGNRPRLNPFVGFGSPRVAPPPTRPPNGYYPGAGSPSAPTNTSPVQKNTGMNIPYGRDWRPIGTAATPSILQSAAVVGSGVQPNVATTIPSDLNRAVHSVPTQVAPVANLQLAPATNQVTVGTTQLKPMPVNDATQPIAPGRTFPTQNIVEISQLPDAPSVPTIAGPSTGMLPQGPYVVITPQVPASPIPTVAPVGTTVPATAIQPQSPPASQSTALGWRPKYSPDATGQTQLR